MQTTDELLTKIVNTRAWYKPLNMKRNYAHNIKSEFLAGTLSDERKKDILIRLGYSVAQPLMWKTP